MGAFPQPPQPVSCTHTAVPQEQDPDLRAARRNGAGSISLLLPRHGGGPAHVPPQVSVWGGTPALPPPTHGCPPTNAPPPPGLPGGSAPSPTASSSLPTTKCASSSCAATPVVSETPPLRGPPKTPHGYCPPRVVTAFPPFGAHSPQNPRYGLCPPNPPFLSTPKSSLTPSSGYCPLP